MSDENDTDTDTETPAPAPTWPRVIPLKHPINFGGVITQLSMRRGVVGDMKGLKLTNDISADQLVAIASRLSGLQTKAIEMLDIEDSGEVMGVVLDFLSRYLGATSGTKRSR